MFSMMTILLAAWMHIVASQYVVYETAMTWSAANTYCANNHGTTLATIKNDDDATKIKDLVASSEYNTFYWIGLNEIDTAGTWEWASGYQCDGDCADLDWWCDNEPNNAAEQCAEFLGPDTSYLAVSGGDRPISYSLNDKVCTKTRYFICDVPTTKCDTFEIDEFLVDCSSEFAETDSIVTSSASDISELKTDVQNLEEAVRNIEKYLDDVRQSLADIDFGYLDDDTSVENVQLWTFSGKDIWIVGLVVVNMVFVVISIMMCNKGATKAGKYGPVSVY